MVITKEEIRTLLNKFQNDINCKYSFDYLNEKNPNPFEWKTVLEGTQGSIYEDGFYMIKIVFSEKYPESMPSITFLNKIFHPHINTNGKACILPIKNDIITVLDTVENMFLDYDVDINHAYENEATQLFRQDPNKFVEKAKEWVRAYAKLEDLDKFYD